MAEQKSDTTSEQAFIVFFRLTMGWTLLWVGIHHFGDDKFVLGFLSHVKTFTTCTRRSPIRRLFRH